MKWLATFLCLLAIPAAAQELPPGTIQLPSSMICGGYNPDIGELQEDRYGELPFLEGSGDVLGPEILQSYQGQVRMFLNPKNGDFTIYLDIRNELTCLIVTGEGMKPILTGKPL
jgi:hypothetical protein